jgi:NAD(P)-dependent dehydrogenase (short-subunit alcohol dehydrogenase family)
LTPTDALRDLESILTAHRSLLSGAVVTDMEAGGLDNARKMVHTESNPMGRLAGPAEVAAVAPFLFCEDSSFVTGSYVLANGGSMAG